MEYVNRQKCAHKIDESHMEYKEGVGWVCDCLKCGAKLVKARRYEVKPRRRPHMSKKERLRNRRESQ